MKNPYEDSPKVVHKINNYSFVINRGSEAGVEVGANFLIFGIGDEMIDPDTRENLGLLEIVRGRARVIHVQERLATLQSSETTITPGQKRKIRRELGGGLAAFMSVPRVEEIEEDSESHMTQINVSVGDIARPI